MNPSDAARVDASDTVREAPRAEEARSANRVHVPGWEPFAENQRPKTSDHLDARLYRYEDTDLCQWWSRRGTSVFHDPFGEPFVLAATRSTPSPATRPVGDGWELPETLDGHWDTPGGRDMAQTYAGYSRANLLMGNLSDLALANAVFMAGRDDLDLIHYQTAAKERIRWLSVQLALAPPHDPQPASESSRAEHKCFECNGELAGPYCPVCNPDLTEENRVLREVLEPFAAMALRFLYLDDAEPVHQHTAKGSANPDKDLLVSDFRRARQALEGKGR